MAGEDEDDRCRQQRDMDPGVGDGVRDSATARHHGCAADSLAVAPHNGRSGLGAHPADSSRGPRPVPPCGQKAPGQPRRRDATNASKATQRDAVTASRSMTTALTSANWQPGRLGARTCAPCVCTLPWRC